MFIVSKRSLVLLAALVWYVGSIVLLLKGRSLLAEADGLDPGQAWLWLAPPSGFALGILKAKFIFGKSCRKNLKRIAALDQPKIWQFFRPGFFVALAAMIVTGETSSRLAHNNYPLLIGVATLDLALASALLLSSYVFWKEGVHIS